jgi:hypothetical protein
MRNCLRRLPNMNQSLQSIIGVTLTLLFTFKLFTRIPGAKFRGISALMPRIVTRNSDDVHPRARDQLSKHVLGDTYDLWEHFEICVRDRGAKPAIVAAK